MSGILVDASKDLTGDLPFGLCTGSPTAVLIPNCTAPPLLSNWSDGAFVSPCSQAGIPDLYTRPGRPDPELNENFSL